MTKPNKKRKKRKTNKKKNTEKGCAQELPCQISEYKCTVKMKVGVNVREK
jgi:hypothetical protein